MAHPTRFKWSDEEIVELRRTYPVTINSALAERLGRRLKDVTRKAYKLGLRKSPEHMERIAALSRRD